MTRSIKKLDTVAMTSPYRFDATPKATTVERLKQNYLFIPKQVKHSYLGYIMQKYGPSKKGDGQEEEESDGKTGKRGHRLPQEATAEKQATTEASASSVIIFVSTCKMCQ